MLIKNEEGKAEAGPADILCIIKLPTGAFHSIFFEEKPMSGIDSSIEKCGIMRLKSLFHNEESADDLEGAKAQVEFVRKYMEISDENVFTEQAIEVDGTMLVWCIEDWLKKKISLAESLKRAELL